MSSLYEVPELKSTDPGFLPSQNTYELCTLRFLSFQNLPSRLSHFWQHMVISPSGTPNKVCGGPLVRIFWYTNDISLGKSDNNLGSTLSMSSFLAFQLLRALTDFQIDCNSFAVKNLSLPCLIGSQPWGLFPTKICTYILNNSLNAKHLLSG